MANVRNLFFPLFAYGLAFEQKNGPGQPQQSYAEVRRELSALWDKLQAEALSQGMGETDFLNAAFAPVAWVDETILKHPTWEHHNQWRIAPLQLQYYKTRRASETFFEHLAQLRPEQTELREIYYLCLRLGFTGQYSRDIDAIHELARKLGNRAVPSQVIDTEPGPPPVIDGGGSPPPVKEKGGLDKPPVPPSFVERVKILLKRPLMPLQSLSQHVASFGKKGINSIKRPLRQPLDALIQRLRAHWLLKAGLGLLVIVPLALFVLWWLRPPQQFQLTVDKEGNGSGTLTASPDPDRICRPPDCAKTTYTYAKGTVVRLQATADADSRSIFEGWKGAADCAQGMTLTANKTCTAIFKLPPLEKSDTTQPMAQQKEPDTTQSMPQPEEPVTTQPMLQQCVKVIDILPQNSHVAEEIQSIGKHKEGIKTVDDALQIIKSSFCDILDIIVPFQGDFKKDFGLEVSLDKPGPNPIYTNDEDLLITVTTSTKFERIYIYIDYYTVSAQVVHLFPNSRNPVHSFVPQGGFTQMALIREPFGLELVTVIASKTPLFTPPRFGAESALSYIHELQNELQKVRSRDDTTSEIATTFYFITTQDKQ